MCQTVTMLAWVFTRVFFVTPRLLTCRGQCFRPGLLLQGKARSLVTNKYETNEVPMDCCSHTEVVVPHQTKVFDGHDRVFWMTLILTVAHGSLA